MGNTRRVKIGNHTIGSGDFSVIAGPCSIESLDQFAKTALTVKKHGAHLLRGGIFKLRTHPDSFQGLGAEAYELAKIVKSETSMPLVSEITDPRQLEELSQVVDVFQVGSRNMHNYALLKELGKANKPILLKRGFSGTIKEWLLSAEYIVKHGNPDVVLCERGIRTFETATRNTFDINAIAFIKQNSDFPIIADPSHGTGARELVVPIALAAQAAGADGVILEVHPEPANAKSDGFQALTFEDFENYMVQSRALNKALRATKKEATL